MDDLACAFAMERRFDQRLSTRIAPFAFGTAFFDDHHRDRFVSNFLNVEGDLDAVEPDDLMHSADEILGSAGYAHRMVLVRSVVRKGPLCQAGFSLDFGDCGADDLPPGPADTRSIDPSGRCRVRWRINRVSRKAPTQSSSTRVQLPLKSGLRTPALNP